MKKQILTVLLLAVLPFGLMAHSPQKVDVTYNKETSNLKVVVTHNVNDPTTHFVSLIVITVDGKEVKRFAESKQQNNKTETVEVVLTGVKPGMKIEAMAKCNLMGSKKGKMLVK